jgi:AraC family transcriptional regulator
MNQRAATHTAMLWLKLGAVEHLHVSLLTDPPGLIEAPPSSNVRVCIHAGPPVFAACRHGREHHRGTTIYGDIDIIPPNTPASWDLKGRDVDLVISVDQQLLQSIVQDSGKDPRHLEVRSRFQARDPQIEHVAWALKAEMETGFPSGRVYTDSLASALAARIVGSHSSFAQPLNGHKGGISRRKLRAVLSFMEDNLTQDISLRQIAEFAGLSVSHFKTVFRHSLGMSAHQYLIRRRVDRATVLLLESKLPIAQIAAEAGFCHQSHLARHMRRTLGVSPRQLRANTSTNSVDFSLEE